MAETNTAEANRADSMDDRPSVRDVAFSCDDNGVRFLVVSVWSLLAHYKGDVPLRVNVFEGYGGHSAESKAKLAEIVARFPFASLRYVDVEKAVKPYEDVILHRANSRWNVFTWTPVFTLQLLPEAVGTVIHFDIDMLFNADISPLFEMDLGEAGRGARNVAPTKTWLIACCYEYDRYGENAGKVVWEKGILPPTVERYFNTGTLVFNVAACREERTWEKIVAWYRDHYDIADRIEQDAWNALYHDRMRPLPVKWNFHDRAIKNYAKWNPFEKYWLGNPPRECYEAALEPAILHFWGPKKPWKVSHRPYRKLYHAAMRAVGQTPPKEPLLSMVHTMLNGRDLENIRLRYELLSQWGFPAGDPGWGFEALGRWVRRIKAKRLKHTLMLPVEWLGIGIGWLILPALPHRLMLFACDVASAVLYAFDRQGRQQALATLRAIRRGTVPSAARERKIVRGSYRNMARSVGHAFWTCRNALAKVGKVGVMSEECRTFLSRNRQAVTVSGHIGCWEILSQLALLEGHAMMSVAKRIGTEAMTQLLMKARQSIGQEIVPADGAFRALMAGARAGKSLGLLVDQKVDPKDGGVWVRFGGRPVPVSAAPAFFAAKAKVPIIVAWSRPLKDGRYRCEMLDVITSEEARDVWQTTQRCARDLERVVRRHPSRWILSYDYFGHHPTEADLETLAERERKERNRERRE